MSDPRTPSFSRIPISTARLMAAIVMIGCSTAVPWAFNEPANTVCAAHLTVASRQRAILVVIHEDTDGRWRFLDGSENAAVPLINLTLGDLVALDSTVRQLADLPSGWKAWRAGRGLPWSRSRIQIQSTPPMNSPLERDTAR